MGQDPEVMEHFPSMLSREESDAMIDGRFENHFDRYGFGLWAVERLSDGRFLGFTGLVHVAFACPIENEVEIGWRLARHAWGQGYALEAASAAITFGFDRLSLGQIVAMTINANARSQRLMGKLGMTRAPELDFDHPRVFEGSPARPQIVYLRRNPRYYGWVS